MDKISAPELLQHIFMNLELKDLLSVRLVCKHWRNTSFLPCFNDNVVVSVDDYKVCKSNIEPLITSGFRISNLKYKIACKNRTYSTVPFWSHYGASLRTLVLDSISFGENVNLPMCLEYCPNLKSLSLEHCLGLNAGMDKYVTKLELSELRVFFCEDSCSCIVPLVSSLAPQMTKFDFTPSVKEDLNTSQLIDIFQHTSKTLTEVYITWRVPRCKKETMVKDCDLIFGAPGLRLKKVSVTNNFNYTDIVSAVVAHHGKWLEEFEIYERDSDACVADAFEQLKCYLAQDLPKLRKFTCAGFLNNEARTEILRFLRDDTAELRTTLREIVVDKLVHLTRNMSNDMFVPKEILFRFDDYSLDDEITEVVWSFLQPNSLQHLTKLHIKNIDLSQNGVFDAIITNCQKLMELNLKACNLTDALLMNGIEQSRVPSDSDWEAILKHLIFPIMTLTRLESLTLVEYGRLTSFSVSRVIKFPNLKSLRLSKIYSLCDSRFPLLAHNNPSLEVANFDRIGLTDNAIIQFARNSPKLVNLNVKGNPLLTDLALPELTKHSRLKELNVECCRGISAKCVGEARKRKTALNIIK